MTSLVSHQEAKDQISNPQPEHDAEIMLLSQLATGIVMNYVGLIDPATGAARGWTETTVPDSVKAAILMVIAKMWAHRGDEEPPNGYLSPQVRFFLDHGYREPVVG